MALLRETVAKEQAAEQERLEQARLNEYDRVEWFDVVRRHWPDLEEAEFDRMWADFSRMKEQRARAVSEQ